MNIKNMIKESIKKIFSELYVKQDQELLLLGGLHTQEVKKLEKIKSFEEIEFKVYSQWGEDGIIQYLINKINIEQKIFIEFGVQDYTESNTRFLLQNNNWSGLVLDGSKEAIEYVQSDNISWRYDLTSKKAFITKDNINDLISEYTNVIDIGILSVDIDGNDYWVWDAIKCIEPVIVIAEYNANFGAEHAITIPYKSNFYRTNEHYSNLYYGASYQALKLLGEKKGYTLIGCNSNGNNMFFVKNKFSSKFREIDESFSDSKFKEARDEKGALLSLSKLNITKLIGECTVYDIVNDRNILIKELKV